MTDSMKFGPEWLRNMSADTTSSNSTSGQITNSPNTFNSGNSFSEGDVSSANNSNISNINTNSLPNNASSTTYGASRNTFPEFRYGREEMLLLFDRNCGLPEILPSYKNLFVERVQYPLALVPSTDEEIVHGPAQLTSDRSWVERNGVVAEDPVVGGSSSVGGGGTLSTEIHNGNTPVSSPRREFSNHPRNLENWRRSRNEDVATGEVGTPTESGWRINSSGYQNSHTRWGRANSWRDDDMPNSEIDGSAVVGGGGSAMMLRSNSATCTSLSERTGDSSVSGKQADEVGTIRSLSLAPSGNRNPVSGSIWPNNASVCSMANMQADGVTNDEMGLPEWAMENPSDIGGTFDASGAFHGAVDDNENTVKQQENYELGHAPNKENPLSKTDLQEISSKTSEHGSTSSSIISQNNSLRKQNDSTSLSPTPTSTILVNREGTDLSHDTGKPKCLSNSTCKIAVPTNFVARDNAQKKKSETDSDNDYSKGSITNYTNNVQNHPTKTSNTDDIPNTNIGDYAERMMKVTDDMIEKLIMDDEDAKDDHLESSVKSTGNKINAHNLFVAMQQSQGSSHPSVSPALGADTVSAAPPNVGLYNIGGIMIDHTQNVTALHQLQQQQMAAVAAVAIGLQPTSAAPHPMTSTAPTDLWLYRDPQAKVQGPFSALEMTEWYRAGYFNENLFVRRVCDARFRPLGELIKICNDQMPFSHSHLIPVDMNPTTITPPLPPVISVQQTTQTTDFMITTLNEHQQLQQHEKLKVNVTAAADSLSNSLKTLINSVDISQVLNMHFQTLQDRFIHNQEIEIANKLSKNECFRRLSPAEKDTIVRQKLQTLRLPEYLTNFTGLSNSLAALNPAAGTQLYDTIVECTKKEQLFNNHQGQQQPQSQVQTTAQQQQKPNIHASSRSMSYMTAEDFILKTKNPSSDMNSTDLLHKFNIRMFLNNGSDSGTGNTLGTPDSHGHEFLSDPQLFGSGSNPTPNPPNNGSQGPMMQMWMNSIASNPNNQAPNQHHSLLSNVPQSNSVNNQWLNGPLVGINSISLSTEQQSSPKAIPASMWDVATLEQHVQQQQHQQQQNLEQQLQQQRQQETIDAQRQLKDAEKHFPGHSDQHQDIDKSANKEENKRHIQQQQQKVVNELKKSLDALENVSLTNDNPYKQEQQIQSQYQEHVFFNEKSDPQVNSKRNSLSNNASKSTNKSKNEHISKKIEEERRREQNEEKRRQKEERKRQQMEEEKRRLLQAEEEKCRQLQEEEKRQQQIQSQRRKALMNNSNTTNSTNINSDNNTVNNICSISVTTTGNQKFKEQQGIQSSIAPWSSQATKLQGPSLVEIQKAERRERRADQQRQMEIQEKQLRALATAEAQDIVVKWNASPLLVKSFAEIQAEEAKRLAHSQMELQRRKEVDAHNNFVTFSSTGNAATGGLASSSNLASIWSRSKIWGSSSNTPSFWEEPLKFNSKSLNPASSNTNTTIINNNGCNTSLNTASIVSLPSNLSQKSPTSQQQQHISMTQPSSNKNIKTSQSVEIMQNTIAVSSAGSSSISNNKKKTLNNAALTGKQMKPLKSDNSNAGGSNESKKTVAKSNNVANKGDDYEAEFIYWCTKTLNNMNTKIDVSTFVSFLRDLESPYEVKDYIRVYLGDGKEYVDFAKQFLERRSKYKNLQRAQNAHDDDLCKPAQAITPSVNDNNENKGKQKKVKKNKMTKLDARILGFSVTAAEGRINVGDRDYVDAP